MADRDSLPSPFYRVSVKALAFDPDARLLVVEDRDGRWQIPGGGWEHGESLEQCVQRELEEELGVQAATIDASAMTASVGAKRLKLTVTVTLTSTDFRVGDGMQSARWVDATTFAGLDLGGGDDILAEHVLALWPRAEPA